MKLKSSVTSPPQLDSRVSKNAMNDVPLPQSRFEPIDFIILIMPPLFWAGNFVLGRAVRGAIPPLTLSFGRWVIALLILLPFAWRYLKRDKSLYWQYRWRILGVSLLGVTVFNSLVYMGLQTTTATNGVLLNSFSPILIVLLGALFYKQHIRFIQACGLLLSFIGVVAIVLQGQWQNLLSLSFAKGDLIIFAAVVCWSVYTLWLRTLPAQMNKVGLLAIQIMVAVLVLLPFFAMEYLGGARPVWSPFSVAVLLYIGIFPSVIAYLLYTFGVARVGAARAGIFLHLMPVFGVLLSTLFLHESLFTYHFIGIVGIVLGIGLSSYSSKIIKS